LPLLANQQSPANLPPESKIGFWMVVTLVMGNMIGSGIFLLPASLAPYGAVSVVGWLVSTCGALLLALVFARLARIDPAAGGPYAYTRTAFGDLAAFLVAWGYWISMWTTLGALAVAFVGYLHPFVPAIVGNPASAGVLAVAVVWLMVGVNVIGVRTAGWVQLLTTVLKILPLVAIAALGLSRFDASHFVVAQPDGGAWIGSVPAVVTLTLWALLGLESATVPAESIHDAERTIPRATIVGTLLTAVIYVSSTIGVMSVLPSSALGQSTAPFADAARMLGGDTAAAVVALGAAISCLGALNGWTLLVGQLPPAVARNGLFPDLFGRVSRRGTPTAGLIVAGVLTTALVAMNYSRGLVELFTFMILLATLNTLIPYVFSSLAIFLIADRHAKLTAGMKLVAGGAFLYSFWAIVGAGAEIVNYGFLLVVAGLPVYVLMRRRLA
jgi:APA family basic amino acid/polyamine antiporter